MNKTELIAEVAEKTGLTKKDCELAISATLDVISDTLTLGDKVQLVGFGTFECRDRAARQGRNPKTLEVIEVPATRVPAFKAGKALKDTVSGK
jgi:DNA-binding protein HU-beta